MASDTGSFLTPHHCLCADSGANRVSCESLYVYIQVFTESQPLIYLGKVFDVYRLEQ